VSKSGTITTNVNFGTAPLGIELTGDQATAGAPVVIDAGLGDIAVTVGSPTGEPLAVSLGSPTGSPLAVSLGSPTGEPLAVSLGSPTGEPLAVSLGSPTGEPLAVTLGSPTGEPLAVTLGSPVGEPIAVLIGSPPGDPLEIKVDPLNIDLGLDNINVCLSLAFTQFPRMQVHMPKKYDWGFSLFGVPVVGFRICGESSFVTEDNPPRIFQKGDPPPGFSAMPEFAQEVPYRVVLSE
jgi:hypothetical protein